MAKEKKNTGNDTTNPPARIFEPSNSEEVPSINVGEESPADPVKLNRNPSTTKEEDGSDDKPVVI